MPASLRDRRGGGPLKDINVKTGRQSTKTGSGPGPDMDPVHSTSCTRHGGGNKYCTVCIYIYIYMCFIIVAIAYQD